MAKATSTSVWGGPDLRPYSHPVLSTRFRLLIAALREFGWLRIGVGCFPIPSLILPFP